MIDWKAQLRERLTATANTAGAWGYCANSAGNAEPTALATLALQAALADNPTDEQRSTWAAAANRGCQWLAQHQAGDGGLSAMPDTTGACWPTPLALLAWTFPPEPGAFAPNAQRATQWLLATRGRALPRNPEIHDHDTMLVGWPWVTDCHSWVEPTAYAIIALRHTGHADNPRVREGVRLLIDRALPDGGWNYGNRRVLEHVLRPFPATTGIALTALAGEARTDDIEQSIDYAHREAPAHTRTAITRLARHRPARLQCSAARHQRGPRRKRCASAQQPTSPALRSPAAPRGGPSSARSSPAPTRAPRRPPMPDDVHSHSSHRVRLTRRQALALAGTCALGGGLAGAAITWKRHERGQRAATFIGRAASYNANLTALITAGPG